MPNWCTNLVGLTGPRAAMAAFRATLAGPSDADFLPQPRPLTQHERLQAFARLAAHRTAWCTRNGIVPETMPIDAFSGWIDQAETPPAPMPAPFSFQQILPIDPLAFLPPPLRPTDRRDEPQQNVGLLGPRTLLWGCKWPIDAEETRVLDFQDLEVGIDGTTFSFDTPWSPPQQVYRALLERLPPDIAMFAYWCEIGNSFAGAIHANGRDGIVREVEHDNLDPWYVASEEDPECGDLDESALLVGLLDESEASSELRRLVEALLD